MSTAKTDPLSNPGTSRVFLCFVKEISNPKAIADFLKIKSPPVIQQLARLKSLGIIKMGEKEGKEQNYIVDWQIFLKLFLDGAIHDRKIIHKEEQFSMEQVIKEIQTLTNNDYFYHLVFLYLQFAAEPENPSQWPTISELILNFEGAMLRSPSLNKKRELYDDSAKLEFFEKLQLWHKLIVFARAKTEENFDNALEDTLSIKFVQSFSTQK
jgi:hypothetical protein